MTKYVKSYQRLCWWFFAVALNQQQMVVVNQQWQSNGLGIIKCSRVPKLPHLRFLHAQQEQAHAGTQRWPLPHSHLLRKQAAFPAHTGTTALLQPPPQTFTQRFPTTTGAPGTSNSLRQPEARASGSSATKQHSP